MLYDLDDTIVAIASPPAGSVEGIVRLSGPGVGTCIARLFEGRCDDVDSIRAPVLYRGELHIPTDDSAELLLPTLLYLWPRGRSYTGQMVAELHTIGCPSLLEATVDACRQLGARQAGPGEFTLRAFLAGRLDLTQAEAVLGVIDAVDRHRLDVALTQLAGGVGGPIRVILGDLLDLLAEIEAELDFAEEEDLRTLSAEIIQQHIDTAATAVRRLLDRMIARRSDEDSHPTVAIVGPPNVGKSSLFNALTSADALVADLAGTTRDYLTATVDLDGVECRLVDTAGLEDGDFDDSADENSDADRSAQSMARTAIDAAQVLVLCHDLADPIDHTGAMRTVLDRIFPDRSWEAKERIEIGTKSDVAVSSGAAGDDFIATSSRAGQGLDQLRAAIRRSIVALGDDYAEVVAGTSIRCRESLACAAESLQAASLLAQDEVGDELIAAELRTAVDHLGQVVGTVYTDDILDRVFSRFCIGK